MNARPGTEGTPRGPVRKRLARLVDPAVSRQSQSAAEAPAPEAHTPGDRGVPCAGSLRSGTPDDVGRGAADPMEHADPARAADAATAENLLRCWVRENDVPRPAGGTLHLSFDASGTALSVPVCHWSVTGWHRFGPPRLDGAPRDAAPVDAVTLAALIGRETEHRVRGAHGAHGVHHTPGVRRPGVAPQGQEPGGSAVLAGRVADSLRRTAHFLAERRASPGTPPDASPFLEGEQSLVLGHPLHPTPKSREGLSQAESHAYAPELRSSFPLHWVAVDPSALAADSAWTERGRRVPVEQLALRLAGDAVTVRLPEGTVPLPLHPWQAHEVRHRDAVAALLEAGALHDLGQCGDAWHPTSSVRTVLRPRCPAMLKLSLGLRITNSRRENLRKEMLRGVEVHRLLRSGLAAHWHAVHPRFDIVRDPAWLGVNGPDGAPVPGLDTVVRHNPFGPDDDAVCVAGLTSLRPWPGAPEGALRSRLSRVTEHLARRTGRPVTAVSAEWFLRYLDAVVRPMLWLDAHAGIALEAHQQNTVVLLDAEGWPEGGRYRDNQGYYFRTSRRAELERRLPGAGVGVASDSFVADEVIDERFAYYLGINNVLGLIGAFGSQGLADERLLLAAFRRFLEDAARGGEGVGGGNRGGDGGDAERRVSPLPALLLESSTLRCKANLLTRLHGLDELVGPVDTQSVYVTVVNPLAR